MSATWSEVMLGDIADDVTVGHVGSMADEYVESGIPFLRSLNVEPFRISSRDLKYIDDAFHRQLKKSSLSPGDVVIVRTGKPGTCAVIPDWLTEANCSDLVVVRCGPDLDPRFLAYYVNSAAAGHVAAHLVGAVQQHFNVASARTMRIPLPSLPEQRAIAAVLGALDDKTELNRKMSRTLKEIARALFDSWFVRFDPVHAKAAGRHPDGMDPSTAALFPDRFEDSELGPIPAGWGSGRLGDIVTFGYGEALRAGDRQAGDIPVFGSNGQIGWHNHALVSGPGIVIGRKGNPGIVTWASKDFFVIDTAFYAIPQRWRDSLHFLHLVLEAHELGAFGADSAVPGLNRNVAYMSAQLLPSDSVVSAFSDQVRPLYDLVASLEAEVSINSQTRDALLPMMLSGQLTVSELLNEKP